MELPDEQPGSTGLRRVHKIVATEPRQPGEPAAAGPRRTPASSHASPCRRCERAPGSAAEALPAKNEGRPTPDLFIRDAERRRRSQAREGAKPPWHGETGWRCGRRRAATGAGRVQEDGGVRSGTGCRPAVPKARSAGGLVAASMAANLAPCRWHEVREAYSAWDPANVEDGYCRALKGSAFPEGWYHWT